LLHEIGGELLVTRLLLQERVVEQGRDVGGSLALDLRKQVERLSILIAFDEMKRVEVRGATRGRSKAVSPGPPMLTRPGGGSFTSSSPNTMTPPGAKLAASRCVASRIESASK